MLGSYVSRGGPWSHFPSIDRPEVVPEALGYHEEWVVVDVEYEQCSAGVSACRGVAPHGQ